MNLAHSNPSLSLRHILILSFQAVSVFNVSSPKPHMHFSSLSSVPHGRTFVHHPTSTWRGINIVMLILRDFLDPPVTFCLVATNVFLNMLFKNFSFFNVRDQVLHSYKKKKKTQEKL
jgi:hypothetical protein